MANNQVPNDLILVLERSIAESQRQREDNRKIMDLLDKERSVNVEMRKELEERTPPPKTSRKSLSFRSPRNRPKDLDIPRSCRRRVRSVYKELETTNEDFVGFDLTQRLDSTHNQAISSRVLRAVKDACPAGEQLPTEIIEAALRCKFKSDRDSHNRTQKGLSLEHARRCRRQGRMREKLNKMSMALSKAKSPPWEPEELEEAEIILSLPELLSSEESDVEVEDGKERKFLVVKRLPWERTKVKNIKKKLRRINELSLSPLQKAMALEGRRDVPNVISKRPAPAQAPDWAVRHI
ncbi:uncharacterized protein LOC135489509 [Lineus longissimus]|uniref:uncharacterized protein LOC135489509 n=1 Tax=Lineus longissimus TaxID=88925 RepID=UPI00315DF6FB